jgi:hypothetical protein
VANETAILARQALERAFLEKSWAGGTPVQRGFVMVMKLRLNFHSQVAGLCDATATVPRQALRRQAT